MAHVVWTQLDLADLIPDAVSGVVDSAGAAVGALSSVLGTTADVLDLIGNTQIPHIDLISVAVSALVELIEAAVEALITTSIGLAWWVPSGYRSLLTPYLVLDRFAKSLDDENDPERPYSTEETDYAIAVIFSSRPTIQATATEIGELLELLGRPLGLPVAAPATSFFDEALEDGVWPPRPPQGQGEAPDWETLRLADVEPLRTAVNALLSLRDSVASSDDNVEQFVARVGMIQRRVSLIADKVAAISQAISDFSEARSRIASLNVLAITGRGDTQDQQAALRLATYADDYPFGDEVLPVGAVCLHAQSSGPAGVELFRSLFGLPTGSPVTEGAETVRVRSSTSPRSAEEDLRNG